MTRPYLLLTNDDGIHAPGIKHLWQALHEIADIAVVAPLSEKSGSGLSITWAKPLHIRQMPWEKDTGAWAVSGTPADCVKMALTSLLPRKPDLIISGANRGSNSGRTVLYSGTVGGIIEGCLKGFPGIAFSFSDITAPPLAVTQKYIVSLVQHFLKKPMPKGSFVNVNFPFKCHEKIAGFRFAKQGRSYWVEDPDKRIHPEGSPYYWLGGKWGSVEEEAESDVALLDQGYVTAVPIHIHELTDHTFLREEKAHIERLFDDDTANLS